MLKSCYAEHFSAEEMVVSSSVVKWADGISGTWLTTASRTPVIVRTLSNAARADSTRTCDLKDTVLSNLNLLAATSGALAIGLSSATNISTLKAMTWRAFDLCGIKLLSGLFTDRIKYELGPQMATGVLTLRKLRELRA